MGRRLFLRGVGLWCRAAILAILALMVPGFALAGTPESPIQFVINPANPDTWVIRYEKVLGGFIISEDGGESWTVMCGTAIDDLERSELFGLGLASDGSIFTGGNMRDGLLTGANLGCDWTTGGAIADNWVNSFAVDANDASLIWAATSNSTRNNGLWRYDGDQAMWEAVGSREYGVGIASVHTVKTADGLRIYEAIDRANADGGPADYFVRYSEDDGINWTTHPLDFEPGYQLKLVAVDPNDPERVVLGRLMESDHRSDHLWISEQAGAPGSWTALGDVSRFGGAAFDSQGDLYFSNAKGDGSLFVLKQGQTTPEKIRDGLAARCLGFAPDSDRLLGCFAGGFGDISRDTGEYSELLSMNDPVGNLTLRSCAGKDIVGVCEAQMTGANGDGWCRLQHWPQSGACAEYGFPALDEPPMGWVQTSGGTQATGGDAVTGGVQVGGGMLASGGARATGGVVGTGGSVVGDAGALDGGVTSGDDPNVTQVGCSCRVEGSGQRDYSTPALVLLALCAVGLRRRRGL